MTENPDHQSHVKTFVFEQMSSHQSQIFEVKVKVGLDSEVVDISQILLSNGLSTTDRIDIYDPSADRFSVLSEICSSPHTLPRCYLEPSIILIRYGNQEAQTKDSEGINSSILKQQLSPQFKEKRSGERTIGQAIQIVKKWRYLTLEGNKRLKRVLNLQQAAIKMGLSKKSLDDYYYQLRLGELYHFDFLNNLHQKMRTLRSYVKDYRPQRLQRKRRHHERHSQDLKILNYYDIPSHELVDVDKLLQEEEYKEFKIRKPEPMQQSVGESKNEERNEPLKISLSYFDIDESLINEQGFNFQDKFFMDYQGSFEEKEDPYYGIIRDFKKEDIQYEKNFKFFQ